MALSVEKIEARKRGVGGTEVLAAVGKDARCSRLELYLRKRDELPEPDFSDNERVYFGSLLEPLLRKEAARRIGERVIQRHSTLFHPSVPLLGHPDGWIPRLRRGLEIKTADRFEAEDFGEPGSDEVPIRYVVQCSAYMALTNADAWYLAVLIGGNDFRLYTIRRDLQLEGAILAGVRDFWGHVQRAEPPAPGTPEDVKLRWPKDLGTSLVADAEIAHACYELAQTRTAFDEIEERKKLEEAQIKMHMAEAANLVDADGTLLATWKTAKGSQKFDEARFEKEHPELHAKYLKDTAGSRRFLLKVK
jgi:predicted phage-related endonuclease